MIRDALDPKTKIYHLSDEHQRQKMEDEEQRQALALWRAEHPAEDTHRATVAVLLIIGLLSLALAVKSCVHDYKPAAVKVAQGGVK
jgi:hypothetical protein